MGGTESTDKKVWRNVAGLVGGNTLGEILQGAVHAVLINALGPAAYGMFGQAMAATSVADGIAAFGLNQLGLVKSVEHRDDPGAYLGTVLALRFTFTLIVLVAVWILSPYLRSTEAWIIRLAALAILTSPLAQTATIPFFLHQDNWKIAWLPGARALVNVSLLGAVIYWAPYVHWAVGAMIGSRTFYALMISELARRRYRFQYGFDREILRELLRIGPKAAWLDAVVIIYVRASYFVLDGLGAAVVGIYTLADNIAQPILRVAGAFSASSLPIVAEFAKEGRFRELWAYFFRNVGRIAMALALIGLALFLGMRPAFELIFPEYTESIPVVWVLFVGTAFMSINQMTSTCLNGMGYFGKVAVVATINLGIYAVGAWLWVAEHGALGAALATTVMEFCNMTMQLSLLWYLGNKRTREAESAGP